MPNYVVGQSQVEASKEGRNLLDFYYACLGYSVYMTEKDSSADKQGAKTELPVCVGLEVLSLSLSLSRFSLSVCAFQKSVTIIGHFASILKCSYCSSVSLHACVLLLIDVVQRTRDFSEAFAFMN